MTKQDLEKRIIALEKANTELLKRLDAASQATNEGFKKVYKKVIIIDKSLITMGKNFIKVDENFIAVSRDIGAFKNYVDGELVEVVKMIEAVESELRNA